MRLQRTLLVQGASLPGDVARFDLDGADSTAAAEVDDCWREWICWAGHFYPATVDGYRDALNLIEMLSIGHVGAGWIENDTIRTSRLAPS